MPADPNLQPGSLPKGLTGPQSLRWSATEGARLELRIGLPPNLERAAARGGISIKLDARAEGEKVSQPLERLDRTGHHRLDEADRTALTQIESWCGGSLHSLIQVDLRRLLALLECFAGQERFYWLDRPGQMIAWEADGRLEGVHRVLPKLPPEGEPAAASTTGVGRKKAVPLAGRKDRAAPVACEGSRQAPSRADAGPGTRPRGLFEGGAEREFTGEENALGPLVDGSTHFLAITLPTGQSSAAQRLRELMRQNGFRLDATNRKWWLRGRPKVLNFLARHEESLKQEAGARFTANFRERTAALKRVTVEAEVREAGRGYEVELRLRGGGDPGAVAQALARGQHYREDEVTGEIVLFDPAALGQLERVRAILQRPELSSGDSTTGTVRFRACRAELPMVETLLEEVVPESRLPRSWKRITEALRRMVRLEAPPLPEALDERLRGYQRLGVAWMWHLYRSGLGGILADEMGLGKTVQALAVAACVREQPGSKGPVLIVAPRSLLSNWSREAARFVPGLKQTVHHGPGREREFQNLSGIDLIITSYGTFQQDSEWMAAAGWSLLIADEAQHAKNRRTRNARALRLVDAPSAFLLTGTPVENSLDDLRSLCEIALPGLLKGPSGSRGDLEARALADERDVRLAAPYILRRRKDLVAPELPGRIEQVFPLALSQRQAIWYQNRREQQQRELLDLETGGASEGRVRMVALTQLLRLRQLCVDPRLVEEAATAADSAKTEALLEILQEAADSGERVLVFSQFVEALKRLREDLEELGISFSYLDGQTGDRQAVVDAFNEDVQRQVFLISLKAGGVGLNLTGASVVVLLDPWWNPAVEDQAIARAHRIGQERRVSVYRLLTEGTVEERVHELARKRAGILREVLEASDASSRRIGLDELKSLLR